MVDFLEVCMHKGVATQGPVIGTHKGVLRSGNHYPGFFYLLRQAQSISVSINYPQTFWVPNLQISL